MPDEQGNNVVRGLDLAAMKLHFIRTKYLSFVLQCVTRGGFNEKVIVRNIKYSEA